jgi:diguanylate cyclase (GGDEF)-like protein
VVSDAPEESTLVADTRLVQERTGRRRSAITVIAGTNLGSMFPIHHGTCVGRKSDTEITIPDGEISRWHARFHVSAEQVEVEDLGSTNGTFVNGEPITRTVLHEGDKLQFGTHVILRFSFQDELDEQFQKQMYDSVARDGLTGAYNRAHFQEHLEAEFNYAWRHDTPVGLVMFDVDHFKSINDTYGHLAGDHVLKRIAETVQQNSRAEDLFARYGGEEFAVISRGIPREDVIHFAERIRTLIDEQQFVFEGQVLPITVSVGVATFPHERFQTASELLARADELLYAAKGAGRNRVQAS